jgi:hypothetical protein
MEHVDRDTSLPHSLHSDHYRARYVQPSHAGDVDGSAPARHVDPRVATVRPNVVLRSRPMVRVVIDNGGTDWLTLLATLLVVVVVVGGLVNWVAQRRLADKRVERERQVGNDQAAADAAVQARIDEAEMRTAARLIQADLSVAAPLPRSGLPPRSAAK